MDGVGPDAEAASIYSEQVWELTGNSHDWVCIRDAIDEIKNDIDDIEDQLDDVKDQLDEKGYWEEYGEITTIPGEIVLQELYPLGAARVTVWADLWAMEADTHMTIGMYVWIGEGGGFVADPLFLNGDQQWPNKLVCDKLTLANAYMIYIFVFQQGGSPITIEWEAIIERL